VGAASEYPMLTLLTIAVLILVGSVVFMLRFRARRRR